MTVEAPLRFGRYQLLERIARGGMAEVFKATSHGVEGFEKLVVVKRVLPSLAENQQFVEMFLNEARLSVALSHANIVQVFDLGREEDTYFLAMEYVAGMDLGQAIRACRRSGIPSPVALVTYLGCEVARALDYAHRRKDASGRPLGLVHRDISPQNILLSYEGEVKVTDFGIAKARSTLDVHGGVKGKHAYMAPEQAEGRAVDARADLYALGVTLYEALAGRNPYFDKEAAEVRRKALAGERAPLREARPDVPEALAAVLERTLSLDPAQRPASAARLYEELAAVQHTLGRRVAPHDLADWLQELRPLHASPSDEERPSVVPETPLSLTAPPVQAHDEVRDGTFVSLSVKADPTVAGEALAPLVRMAERHGATVLEREPTGFVALFGLEHPDGHDIIRATHLALRFHAAAQRSATAREPIASVGAGVHPARVTVRGDGTSERDDRFDEALRVAKALAAAARNRVLASDAVAVAGSDQFECIPVAEGAVAIKGPLTAARRRVAGRRDLFRVFGELLAKAANEGAQVLTVTAEAGLGKTRFLEEVVYRLRKMGHPVTWFSAECLFHEREVPLSALQAMLRALLAIDETDADTVVREKARRLRDYGLTPEEMLAAGGLLGVVSAGAGGDPRVAHRVLRGALRKIFQGSASGQVSVFAWDGAEHMDAPSRAALHELLQDAGTLPVLFVVAGRPGRPWPWHDATEHHRFTLDPLSQDDLHTLVSLRLGNRSAPPELVAALAERSRANPFHVEEYLKAWLQAGTVVVDGDAVRFVPPPSHEVPGTVRGLVASRVSHLAPVERRLLQVASVFGLRAPHEALAEAAELDAVTFRDALDALVSAGLLAPVDGGEAQFTDALLHDVLYSAITPEMRRVLHRAVGEAQERRAGERMPMLAARIAHHFRQAGDARHADTLLKRAR